MKASISVFAILLATTTAASAADNAVSLLVQASIDRTKAQVAEAEKKIDGIGKVTDEIGSRRVRQLAILSDSIDTAIEKADAQLKIAKKQKVKHKAEIDKKQAEVQAIPDGTPEHDSAVRELNQLVQRDADFAKNIADLESRAKELDWAADGISDTQDNAIAACQQTNQCNSDGKPLDRSNPNTAGSASPPSGRTPSQQAQSPQQRQQQQGGQPSASPQSSPSSSSPTTASSIPTVSPAASQADQGACSTTNPQACRGEVAPYLMKAAVKPTTGTTTASEQVHAAAAKENPNAAPNSQTPSATTGAAGVSASSASPPQRGTLNSEIAPDKTKGVGSPNDPLSAIAQGMYSGAYPGGGYTPNRFSGIAAATLGSQYSHVNRKMPAKFAANSRFELPRNPSSFAENFGNEITGPHTDLWRKVRIRYQSFEDSLGK